MKTENKNRYIPCELKVVTFEVERPFASPFTAQDVNTPTQGFFNYVLMQSATNDGTQNQQYGDAGWGSGAELWE